MSEYNNPRPLPTASASDPCVVYDNSVSFDKLINESEVVTTYKGVELQSVPSLLEQIEAEANAAVISLGWDPAGEFSTGFTYTKLNDVGRDTTGSWWRYNGSDLPKVISAGTVPSSPNFSVISFETADHVKWEIGKSVGYVLDDYQGVKDELYSQAGIIDDGTQNQLGDSQFVDAINIMRWRSLGDARGWGAKFDGVTDDTAAITQCLSESFLVRLSGNILVSDTFLLQPFCNIVSDGAKISTTNPTKSIFYADNVDNWSISGKLKIEKKDWTSAPTTEIESACGIAVQDCLNFTLDNIDASGFSGTGFYFTSSSPESRSGVSSSRVNNCSAYHNYAGFRCNPGFASEYIAFTGCISRYNHAYGVRDAAGNMQWTGGQITHNVLIGVSIQNGFNDAHGNMTGTAINHNGGKAIEVIGTDNGFTFVGCSVFDNAVADGYSGAIYFDHCSGVVFSGCQLMVDIVELSPTGRNLISNCVFANAPSRLYSHLVTGGMTNVLLRGCTRAGLDSLNIPNAFGNSGIRFRRSTPQVGGVSADIIFDSPDFVFGQMEFDTLLGTANVYHEGLYFADINVRVDSGSTGIYLDVYLNADVIATIPAGKRNSGSTWSFNSRITFAAGRGDKLKLSVRSDVSGFTIASGSLIQVALMD